MIDYTNMDLYYEDSVDKQLKIEAEDGTVITNEDIFSESMTLEEGICSSNSLIFGSCESSKFYVKFANHFSPLYGQWIDVSETLAGDESNPFVFGRYKVQSDKPTADREYREITAYDAMYDIINADGVEVADWYNEVLPDEDSTITLYNFRKSFIAHFGLEEIETSLVNDDIVLEKTISTSSLSGQRVLEAICDINGVFAHITRDNKFEYIQLDPIDETQAFDIPLYKNCDYEDFETTVINCLQIREDDSDPGVVYGSGANRYIISGNFLLYGMTTEDLITVTANLYPVINKITYRPSTINAPGNPCLEVGDQIHLSSKYQEIYTYVLERNLTGIQALNDEYDSNGTETYVDSGGSIEEKIEQVKSRTAELADEVERQDETINVIVESLETDYASILVLEAEVANIQTMFAEYATIEDLEAAVANISQLFVSYEEVETLLANYASIEDLEALYANIETIVAGYITADVIKAAVADLGYVTADWVEANFANIEYLEAYYATITDLEAVYGNITLLDSDVANIINVLAGNVGTGNLQSVHLTADNAVIDEAVIVNALIDTVLADIIRSNIIYTDTITIMSENGGIIISGTTMQFSDSSGTVRLQLGEDADGNFTFVLYDESGTGIMIDSEGIHESAVPDGLIVDSMVSDEANISGYKLNIAEVTQILNEQGLLQLEATQVTIDGETLDYRLTEITQTVTALESAGIASVTNYYALGGPDYPPCDPGEELVESILGTMILGESLLGYTGWTTERLKAEYDEYLWYCQQIVYIDGTIAWTTPTLITDDYIRSVVNTQQTELEVIQGQITAKVWESDIETATDSIWSQVNILTDNYGQIVINIDSIVSEVASLTTTEGDHYRELSSDISSITIELGNITSTVSSVQESLDNIESYAVTNTTIEYYKSTSPSECEGGSWSTTMPAWEAGYYIWMRTTVTYGFGSESRAVTSEPVCLTLAGYDLSDVSITSIETYYAVNDSSEFPPDSNILLYENFSGGELPEGWSYYSQNAGEFEFSSDPTLGTYVKITKTSTGGTYPLLRYDFENSARMILSVKATTEEGHETSAQLTLHIGGNGRYYSIETPNEWVKFSYELTSAQSTIYIGSYNDVVLITDVTVEDADSEADWQPDMPTVEAGEFLWVRYLITYIDGHTEWTDPVCVTADSSLAIESMDIYYSLSDSNSWYQPFERVDYPSVVGEAIVGSSEVGVTGIWTTEQPTTSDIKDQASIPGSMILGDNILGYSGMLENEYVWMAYLITYTDGITAWTEPTLLTDPVVKDQVSTLQEQYSQIEQTVNSISLTVFSSSTTGDLGGMASIVLKIGGREELAELDLSRVREAFANDNSSITISAGTILFASNTLLISSDQFLLDGAGNATFSGVLSAPSGTIGGWTIGTSALYNGTSSMTSTTVGTYIGTNGIRQYASSSAYVNIQNGIITAYGANISGSITATSGTIGNWTITSSSLQTGSYNTSGNMYFGSSGISLGTTFLVSSSGSLTATSGTIGGWTIGTSALYNGTSSMTSTTVGTYIGTSGIRQYASSTAYVNIQNGVITAYGANISGTITATSGSFSGTITAASGSTIGGWTLTTGKIYGGTSSTGVAVMQAPSSSITWVFAAGGTSHDSYATCPFRVDKEGNLYASGGAIAGFTLTSSSLYNSKSSLTSTTSGVYIGTNGISVGGSVTTAINTSGQMIVYSSGSQIGYVEGAVLTSSSGYGLRVGGYSAIGLLTGTMMIGDWYSSSATASAYTCQSGSLNVVSSLTISATSSGGVSWSYSFTALTFSKGLLVGMS